LVIASRQSSPGFPGSIAPVDPRLDDEDHADEERDQKRERERVRPDAHQLHHDAAHGAGRETDTLQRAEEDVRRLAHDLQGFEDRPPDAAKDTGAASRRNGFVDAFGYTWHAAYRSRLKVRRIPGLLAVG